jgi:SPP1 family predicted phage head-tail adaptor
MRMIEEIKLRTLTITADAGGFPTQTVATKTVYAEKKSVRQSEFFQADASGRKAEIVFVVNADEFGNETEVEFGGVVYSIYRTYQAGLGRVELYCQRM